MSQVCQTPKKEYEIRKIHHEGKNRISRGVVIPLKFLKVLDIDQGDYVKIYLAEKGGAKKVWIEKLLPQE